MQMRYWIVWVPPGLKYDSAHETQTAEEPTLWSGIPYEKWAHDFAPF